MCFSNTKEWVLSWMGTWWAGLGFVFWFHQNDVVPWFTSVVVLGDWFGQKKKNLSTLDASVSLNGHIGERHQQSIDFANGKKM